MLISETMIINWIWRAFLGSLIYSLLLFFACLLHALWRPLRYLPTALSRGPAAIGFSFAILSLSLAMVWPNQVVAKAVITERPVLNPEALAQLWALELPRYDGEVISLASLRGEKPLVLNFWATWCAPCVREMPLLDEFAKKHPDIQFIGFTIDSLKNMQKFEQGTQVSYPLLVAGSRYLRLIKQLGNPRGGLPFTLVFDEKGEVHSLLLGEIEKEQLESLIHDFDFN